MVQPQEPNGNIGTINALVRLGHQTALIGELLEQIAAQLVRQTELIESIADRQQAMEQRDINRLQDQLEQLTVAAVRADERFALADERQARGGANQIDRQLLADQSQQLEQAATAAWAMLRRFHADHPEIELPPAAAWIDTPADSGGMGAI